jgi:hypothetical protein
LVRSTFPFHLASQKSQYGGIKDGSTIPALELLLCGSISNFSSRTPNYLQSFPQGFDNHLHSSSCSFCWPLFWPSLLPQRHFHGWKSANQPQKMFNQALARRSLSFSREHPLSQEIWYALFSLVMNIRQHAMVSATRLHNTCRG